MIMEASSEKEPLVETEIKVYKRRWYILALFSLLAMYQWTVWNTWGPVANTVKVVFPSWSNGTISLFGNWGSIAFLVFLLPLLFITEKSLRASILVGSGLVFLGTAVKCAFLVEPHMPEVVFTILCHVGAILNGIPGIVVTSAPPAVSAAWFPPEERVMATSISQMLNNIGTALSFLMATLLVPEFSRNNNNTSNSSCLDSDDDLMVVNATEREMTEEYIHNYLLWLAGPATALFLLILIYFPSKPPLPPSYSSTQDRLEFLPGINQLLRSPSAWTMAIVWAIPQAVWNNWCALMVISLTKIGTDGSCLSEKWVNILGIVAVLVGTVVAILVGMVADKIKGHIKKTIIALLTAGGAAFTLLTLISTQVISLPSIAYLQVCVYVFLLVGNSLLVSTSPLCMEFTVEKLYPIPEAIVGGWMNIWYNIISIFFLGILSIPGVGTTWLHYILPLSCFMVIPLLLGVREEYRRQDVDNHQENEERE